MHGQRDVDLLHYDRGSCLRLVALSVGWVPFYTPEAKDNVNTMNVLMRLTSYT